MTKKLHLSIPYSNFRSQRERENLEQSQKDRRTQDSERNRGWWQALAKVPYKCMFVDRGAEGDMITVKGTIERTG